MNKVIIISAFDNYSYNVRIKFVERYFESKGYEVTILAADFDHRNKKKYTVTRENLRLVNVLSYNKNLSLERIVSHKRFAMGAFEIVQAEKPDILYVSTPPNFLFKYAYKYKLGDNRTKIIFEIGDMWPETLPVNKFFKFLITPPLLIWKNLRDRYIKCADGIVFECNLFKEYLVKYSNGVANQTIYLTKEFEMSSNTIQVPSLKNGINLCYVGSLNNIFDEDLTSLLLNKVNEAIPVTLHLIGDGEKKTKFLEKLNGIKVIDHGIVYDECKKSQIYSKCHFGLNLMKTSVFVGLTMKSIEYFSAGLPIINNIPKDTEQLIDNYECGYNYDGNNVKLIKWLKSIDDNKMDLFKSNTYNVYNKYFTVSAFNNTFDSLIKEVIKNND